MKRRHIWVYGILALVAVWMAAAGGMGFARSRRMTAEKVMDYIKAHPFEGKNDAERMEIVEEMADRVNRLPFEERQQVRFDKNLHQFFFGMKTAEQTRYLDLTLPKGMHEMMEAFNKMPPDRRKRLVDRAVSDLGRAQSEVSKDEMNRTLSDQNVKRIIDEGFKSYMRDADAAAKLEIQPLIEEVQAMMQATR